MAPEDGNVAKSSKIGGDAAGNQSAEDRLLAWAAGARAFTLTPR